MLNKNRKEEPKPFLPATEEIGRKLDMIGRGTQSTSNEENYEGIYYH